jgi:hypothetical protein
MGNITLSAAWAWLLAAALAIDTFGRAFERIAKARKAAQAPNDQQNKRLDDLEAWKAEADRKLLNDNNHLINIDSDNRVTQRALLALLDHGIDGNNIKQMQHAKEELQEHLINR